MAEYYKQTLPARARALIRDVAVGALSVGKSIGRSKGWIRFPCYHHVFDEERRGFLQHLRYMRNYGEFVTIDQVLEWWEGGSIIDGRYFCVTFDDGIRNQFTNALPILVERNVPACFFIPSGYVGGNSIDTPELAQRLSRSPLGAIDFVTWNDCRTMLAAGMSIGSHTEGHRRLADLSAEQCRSELRLSKSRLEKQLTLPIVHFAAPWGVPNVDFSETRDVGIAVEEGYRSFLTTRRGANATPSARLGIRRDVLMAGWGLHQLRYFLTR